MLNLNTTIFKCPKCSYLTNKFREKSPHELKCDVSMELLTLNEKHYEKVLYLSVEGSLKIEVFI